jgi:ketosteroid isomerase-like protein
VLTAGNLALVTYRRQLRGTLPDGAPIEQQGRTIDVLRRDDDGQWCVAIDNPWDGVDPA